MLRDTSAGASQQQVALTLGMFASRMVALVDELQERKLVERLPNPEDRRTYSLALTAEGRRVLEAIGRVAREHQEDLLGALSKAERDTPLRRCCVADQQVSCAVSIPGLPAWGQPIGNDQAHFPVRLSDYNVLMSPA